MNVQFLKQGKEKNQIKTNDGLDLYSKLKF
jgi:hypothetical protein